METLPQVPESLEPVELDSLRLAHDLQFVREGRLAPDLQAELAESRLAFTADFLQLQ
jgi:hypothetical protein